MAQDLNVVALVGNLTKDPELRHIPSGTALAELRIAVNDRVKRSGEWVDAVYYFDVTVWGNQAEACAQYLAKGKKVGVRGKLTFEEWEAKDGGGKRSRVRVVADSVQFLTPQNSGGDSGYGAPSQEQGAGGDYGTPAAEDFPPASADDDIPF